MAGGKRAYKPRKSDLSFVCYVLIDGQTIPVAKLDDIVFGAWDVYPANAFQSAMYAEVLKEKDIMPVKDELEKIVDRKSTRLNSSHS